jgi:putative component of toxin-antitoxin plasmid stabilization module
MSSKAGERAAIEVHPNEYDGWDVIHAGTADAISNHPDKESAIEAARRIAEHEEGDVEVQVKDEVVEETSDEGRGVRFYFLALIALLIIVTLIIVIVSLVGGGTEFGANDANLGE